MKATPETVTDHLRTKIEAARVALHAAEEELRNHLLGIAAQRHGVAAGSIIKVIRTGKICRVKEVLVYSYLPTEKPSVHANVRRKDGEWSLNHSYISGDSYEVVPT